MTWYNKASCKKARVSPARMEAGSTLWKTHDSIKDNMSIWAQEHFVKPLLANTAR